MLDMVGRYIGENTELIHDIWNHTEDKIVPVFHYLLAQCHGALLKII